ncbi:MAG: sulfite exporter TauE/SafE family protein, partial [Bacteroidota bacterium]|nr:sulfite exporter TauE/SafE family protein [Bacteroidota bacterium]
MGIFEAVILILTGISVGFINTLAGGATIISLSVLMFMGLPLNVANGTHRIAAAFQTATSVATYKKKNILDWRKGLVLAIPTIVGSIIGARIAVDINEELFKKIVAVVMIVILLMILYKPQRWLQGNEKLLAKKIDWKQILLFFALGLYGGFIYVGIGYFLLAAIVLSVGHDVVKANAIKVFIVMLYVPFTLGVFIWGGVVNFEYGFVLAIGQIIGGYIGAKAAITKGTGFVRWV